MENVLVLLLFLALGRQLEDEVREQPGPDHPVDADFFKPKTTKVTILLSKQFSVLKLLAGIAKRKINRKNYIINAQVKMPAKAETFLLHLINKQDCNQIIKLTCALRSQFLCVGLCLNLPVFPLQFLKHYILLYSNSNAINCARTLFAYSVFKTFVSYVRARMWQQWFLCFVLLSLLFFYRIPIVKNCFLFINTVVKLQL